MSGTITLYLLILCGIWSQGFIGTLANEETKGSSDILNRQKRVVSYDEPGGARIPRIEDRPYIAYIKLSNRMHCAGTILSHRLVVTSFECISFPESPHLYKVVSKSARIHFGTVHNTTDIKLHNGNIHDRPMDGIALLTIDPAIVYGLFVKNIELHVGPLLPNVLGTVSGWGFNSRNRVVGSGTNFPYNLRTIQVPILAHRECVERYQSYYPITDKDICTFHPRRNAGHTDGGAPLVIDNKLVGIFLRSGPLVYRYNRDYPDVFALLQHTYYSNWIRAKISANV